MKKLIASIIIVASPMAYSMSEGQAALLGIIIGSQYRQQVQPPVYYPPQPVYVPPPPPPVYQVHPPMNLHEYCSHATHVDGVFDPPMARHRCMYRGYQR